MTCCRAALGDQVRWDDGGVAERLVEITVDALELVGEVRLDEQLRVVRAISLGHESGRRPLVDLVAEAHGEGLDARAVAGERRADGTRIDAARQEYSERHIGDRTHPYRPP